MSAEGPRLIHRCGCDDERSFSSFSHVTRVSSVSVLYCTIKRKENKRKERGAGPRRKEPGSITSTTIDLLPYINPIDDRSIQSCSPGSFFLSFFLPSLSEDTQRAGIHTLPVL